MVWLDDYERRARLVPGLLALSPIAIVILCLGLRANPLIAGVASLLTAIGGPVVLAGYVRARGLSVQTNLFKSWGGAPTLQRLLLSVESSNPAMRDARRHAIESMTGRRLPTLTEERDDRAQADQQVEAAVAELRTKTRNTTDFPLVFAENRNYGFERNLYGMRSLGIWSASIALISVGVIGSIAIYRPIGDHAFKLGIVFGLFCLAAILVYWLRAPTEKAVRAAGERYAEELLTASLVLLSK